MTVRDNRATTEAVSTFLSRFGPKSRLEEEIIPALASALSPADDSRSVARRRYVAFVSRALLVVTARVSTTREVGWRTEINRPDWKTVDDTAATFSRGRLEEEVSEWLESFLAGPLFDPLRVLQESVIPSSERRRHGEFYTPEWLADHVVRQAAIAPVRWLDPTAGSGAFLLALARQAKATSFHWPDVMAMERDAGSALGSAAAIALAQRWLDPTARTLQPIGVGQIDILSPPTQPSEIFQVDQIVGNPPWVLWDQLESPTRAEMARLWRHYGLQTETGMNSILGGGKRDLAFLVLLVCADRWLAPGGRLTLVVPSSMFKSTTSGRGLRRWMLPDGTPLSVELVEDLTGFRPFPGVQAPAAIIHVVKGTPTRYPVAYHVWKTADPACAEREWAEPSDPSDNLSAWSCTSAHDAALPPSLEGPCEYSAHLGVNTGGANGLYWFKRMEEKEGCWRMTNLASRGKHSLAVQEVMLEPTYLYPILLGKDVQAWHAEPSAWILMVQDFERRRGVLEETLAQGAPLTLRYLKSHEAFLRGRAAYRRYFERPGPGGIRTATGAFYSMFNVGPYTRAPYKVVWNRMGGRLVVAVVSEREGTQILPQETHAFFGVELEAEADYLCALLNSRWAGEFLRRQSPQASKSFATPRVIHRLQLLRYQPSTPLHRELSQKGKEARLARTPSASLLAAIDECASQYWGKFPV